MKFKFFICLFVLLLPFGVVAKELTAIGFVEADADQVLIKDKIRLTFIRTDSCWISSCFFENFYSCPHLIMKNSWQIIDADGKYIDVGTLKPSKATSGSKVGFTSIAKPLNAKPKFDSTLQSRYTWAGTTYPPLLAVPKGTHVEIIQPVTMKGSAEQKIKDKLVKQYFRKKRTVCKCDSNETLISERDAKSSDVVIKPLVGYKDNVSFYEVLIPDTSGCGILDDGMELMAVKNGKVVNLTESSGMADDRPTTTAMTLFNRYVFSTKELQDTVYVFFAGGYNLDGYILLDSELNVRAVSTWNYH